MNQDWIIPGFAFLNNVITDVDKDKKIAKVKNTNGMIPVKQFWGFHEFQALKDQGYC